MTKMKPPVEFTATNIKQLRGQSGMSRKALTDALEDYGISMHQNSLRRIEEGQQQVKIVEAIAFSKVFNIPLENLITSPINPAIAQVEASLSKSKRTVRNVFSIFTLVARSINELVDALEDENTPPVEQSEVVKEAHEWVVGFAESGLKSMVQMVVANVVMLATDEKLQLGLDIDGWEHSAKLDRLESYVNSGEG